MPLLALPTELLENIILRTLPDAFTSLSLTCKTTQQILANITKLELWNAIDTNHPFEDLNACFRLPRLQQLLAVGYETCGRPNEMGYTNEEWPPFQWPLSRPHPSLRRLELCAAMYLPELASLLANLPMLQSFKLVEIDHMGSFWSDCWDVNEVVSTLRRYYAASLVELSLTLGTEMNWIHGSKQTFVGFSCLQYIEIDASIILGEDIASLPPLPDILPPAIMGVRILVGSLPDEPEAITRMFCGWHLGQCDSVPLLERVQVVRGTRMVGWFETYDEVVRGGSSDQLDHWMYAGWRRMEKSMSEIAALWDRAREAVLSAGCEYLERPRTMAVWIAKNGLADMEEVDADVEEDDAGEGHDD